MSRYVLGNVNILIEMEIFETLKFYQMKTSVEPVENLIKKKQLFESAAAIFIILISSKNAENCT